MALQHSPPLRALMVVALALCAQPARGVETGPAANVTPAARAWKTPAIDNDHATSKLLPSRNLLIPVDGVSRRQLLDTFAERRGDKPHEAIDIAAPRGTRVVATDDGHVVKLFRSVAGGLTVYQFDRDERFAYYYAHLDAYAEGLREGAILKRGELIGYVGSSGNATPEAPHLHFTIYRLLPTREWWKGTAINPYPYLNDR